MRKKMILAVSALALSACERADVAPPVEETAPAPATPSEQLSGIADEYLKAIVALYPFSVTFAGLGDAATIDNADFNDNTPEGRASLQALEDRLAERLAAIDEAAFPGGEDWVLYRTLQEAFAANQELRVCNRHLWSINHMFGWQNGFSRVAAAQPVASEEDKSAALTRWSQLPIFIAQEQAYLEEGLLNDYSAPKRVAARVVAQLDKLLEIDPSASPFIAFAANTDDESFKAAAVTLVVESINPAIEAHRDYLRDVYIPAARDDLSITGIPNGEACYEAMLRDYHTAEFGAAETFRRGQEAVEANRAGVIARGEALFGISDFTTILARVNAEPANRFTSEQALIDETRAMVPVTKEKVAPFFSSLPAQKMIVEPYPDYLKGSGQSSRYEQKPPGEGPATYRINTDNWETDTRGGAEIVAVHEGWPGHHLQIATSHQLDGLHPVLKLLRSTAFTEGWARYSEALAEEAGVYESGYGEITRRAWPARGMVADPGLHVFGWSNEQAQEFLQESGRFQEQENVDALLDRIAVIPGQLTAYDTGGLVIFELRAEAEAQLGDRFDIRAFHDRVLEHGSAPLSALQDHVRAWIAAEAAGE